MKRWLRQHRYALAVAIRRLWLHPFSSVANLLVIALTLALPILGASFLAAAQPVVKQVSISPEITLFMAPDAQRGASESVAKTLADDYKEHIEATRLVPREQALATLKRNPNWADALAVLPGNPLPDAIIVTLKNTDDLAAKTTTLTAAWKALPGVHSVQHDANWVQRLAAILDFVRIGLGMLAAGVALVVLATVFNTVRMQALTQREEIAVARLVGATESFVRRPFLYLGALTGALAGVCAIGIASLALHPLNQAIANLANSYGTQIRLQLPDGLWLSGSIVGVAVLAALSARWSVTRNTRF
ncbi:permease [Pusillimonas sp. T2]|uniref:cell division protein FtsX n=1 Tax=Pusillimonas sp. T2 TaxID=1548123 RepID=UPI000B9465DE|nr:ABC transporter permease [Pusillimonas sp. T2]OXR49970.1 permease [Pusillimonas sp. T2]